MAVEAQLLIIGSELTEGRLRDAHGAFLSRELTRLGFYVAGIHLLPDDPAKLRLCMQRLLESPASVIISVGGLGHTSDDLTKPLWAEILGDSYDVDAQLLSLLQERLQKRGVTLPYIERYAEVPRGGRAFPNPVGLAPALLWEYNEKVLWALPGVPAELQAFWTEVVQPYLLERFGLATPLEITLRTTGLTESGLSARLRTWEAEKPAALRLAYNPSWEGVSLHLSAPADFPLAEFMHWTENLRQIIGPYIYAEGPTTLPAALIAALRQQGLTISTAESCTGGHIAAALVDVPGASDVLRGSVVAYHNDIKKALLNVPALTLETEGAVSEPTAQAMVRGIRNLTRSSIGIATTGIAGPTGGTPTKPVGLVYIAIETPDRTFVKPYHFPGGREVVIARATATALSLTWQILMQLI
jgi:nicotinamide-nucleotide amidase